MNNVVRFILGFVVMNIIIDIDNYYGGSWGLKGNNVYLFILVLI